MDRFLGGKIRVQLLQDPLARLLDVHVEIFQDLRGHAVAFAQQAEQNVFRADVSVIERLGFLGREREDFFHARRVGNVADHFLVGAGADLFLDFHADGFEVDAHALQHVHGDALPQLDQAEQQMLRAEKIVIETVGFLACQREHLLRARREIAHGFIAHTVIHNATSLAICPMRLKANHAPKKLYRFPKEITATSKKFPKEQRKSERFQ